MSEFLKTLNAELCVRERGQGAEPVTPLVTWGGGHRMDHPKTATDANILPDWALLEDNRLVPSVLFMEKAVSLLENRVHRNVCTQRRQKAEVLEGWTHPAEGITRQTSQGDP